MAKMRSLPGLAVLGALLGMAFLAPAQAQIFPQTLPANTVVGRLGAGQAGPAEAVPFARLAASLFGGCLSNVPLVGAGSGVAPTCWASGALGTAAAINTGTSGATIPLLNGNNIFSGNNVFTGGLTPAIAAITAAGDIASTACGKQVRLSGAAFYNSNFTAVGNYANPCVVTIFNDDSSRFKYVTANGVTQGQYVGPGQAMTVTSDGAAWHLTPPAMLRVPDALSNFNLYVASTGSDTMGVTDGMSAAAPFATPEHAYGFAVERLCFGFTTQTHVIVNFAPGFNDTGGLHLAEHDTCAAGGETAVEFIGATLPITSTANAAGLVRVLLASTASYATNDYVCIYGVVTGTEANGCFQITVIDGTHLDLKNSVYVANGTGGTITNKSGINTTGLDAVDQYYSAVTYKNLTFQSDQKCLNSQYGAKAFIGDGNLFLACTSAAVTANDYGNVIFNSDAGIGTAASTFKATNGIITAGVTFHVVKNINYTSAGAWGVSGAYMIFIGGAYNLHGYTVTDSGSGKRWASDYGSAMLSGTGAPNTFFPGSTNGACSFGGQMDTGCATMLGSNNLSEVTNAATARSNLGLGTIATQAASAVAVTGGTLAGLTGLAIRDTSAAFDLTIAATSSTPLSAGRALTVDVVNAARTLKLGANLTLASDPGTVTGVLKSNGTGTFAAAACADLSNGGTACTAATGTSGATVPLLNGTNTWSGVQSFNSGDLVLKGATSGTITVNAASVAGSNTITLPAGTTDFSATGGTSQFVKQASAGAALTVVRPVCGDLSDSGSACLVNTGVSGHTIGFLDGNTTQSGNTNFTGTLLFTNNGTATISSNGQGSIGSTTASGLRLAGQGSASDFTLLNSAGSTVCSVATGTTTINCNTLTLTNGLANAQLANSAVTINGKSTALGTSYTAAATTFGWANPTGTLSTTKVMLGIAGSITPTSSGIVSFSIYGGANSNTAGDGCLLAIHYGTGTAPVNGAAVTGTDASPRDLTTKTSSTQIIMPFDLRARASGLTLSTAYWYDISFAAVTGGTCTLTDIGTVVQEQ